uniref:hypothetical protein n=1 Tax=uncultured Draconibacterium sp. TaxID=1573823 RepID=UPI0032168EEA
MKNIRNLFRYTICIILFLLTIGCPNDEEPESLTGDWDITLKYVDPIDGTDIGTLTGIMELTHDGNKLSGEVSDQEGSTPLLSSCCVQDNNVAIDFYIDEFLHNLEGIINSSYNSMDGEIYIISENLKIEFGTWSASKSLKGASLISSSESKGDLTEKLYEILLKYNNQIR